MTFTSKLAALFGTAALLGPLVAAPIQPTAITVTVPAGSNNGSRTGTSASTAYIDDALLASLTFPGGFVTASGAQFSAVIAARVIAERDAVNAEFGDSDTGSDGNPNPFVTAGLVAEGAAIPFAIQESTTPSVQDAAIQAAFGTLSLVQGIDGESANYVLDLLFGQGIVDNNDAADLMPELVFFERGVNSDFRIQLLIGGTWATPVFHSTTVDILRGDLWSSPVFIDSVEISTGQRLGIAGLDLNDFNVASGTVVYGVRITSLNGSGADLYGNFLSAESTSQFRDPLPLAPVPEPESYLLIAAGLYLLAALGRRRTESQK